MTGLPVDFKVQRISDANEKHGGPREPLVAHVPRESEREDEWDGRCVSCGREMSRELPGPRACSRECATQAQAEHATPAAQVCEILVAPDRLDGGFTASFTWPKPMTGCVSQGDSIPETLRNLADAAEGVMAVIAVDAERQS